MAGYSTVIPAILSPSSLSVCLTQCAWDFRPLIYNARSVVGVHLVTWRHERGEADHRLLGLPRDTLIHNG